MAISNYTSPSIITLLVMLFRHISGRRRRQFGLLMGLILVSAFMEVISLGAVLPFLGILVAPDRVFGYPIIADVAQVWGITSADQLVFPLTVAFAAAALLAAAIRILLMWASTRLAVTCGTDLSIEVYRRTLYQPYQFHLARNSSELISGITNKVNSVVFGVLMPLLTLVSSTILLLAIMITLLAIDPMAASVAAVGFGTGYALITWISRKQLHRNSQRIAYEQTKVIKALQEGLGGIRDVLLDGSQPAYCDIYRKADRPLRLAYGNNTFISGSPRPAMEALGMVLIAALAYSLSLQVGAIATALPMLGVLALGAQRLLPALQQIYSAWVSIAGSHASLADTIELLVQPLPAKQTQPVPAPLPFHDTICLNAVRFRYIDDGPWVLNGINLTIPRGARVGFVGSTGSGKSTTLDLLMGLLMPTEGELHVDGQSISGIRVRAWQQIIAHVPQNIYLADATIAENIAFGVPPEAIDLDRVQQAARQAQIANFIESRLEGYQAYVGERGIRLSGGQCQRIGIARALYKQANVLVFDEATSALDNSTEQSVMDAIEGLSSNLTILLIAHRLTTVRRCDTIVELEQGKVVAQGTYEQLLEHSPSFQRMARDFIIK
jgi:ABC-type multidrug transport system fused ATPase/permease subunit